MGNGIVEILKEIPDYRIGNAKKHRLEEILTVSVLSVLSDCTQFTEIELFGKEQEEWLKTFLKLEHGIPSHDTFGDVFAAIDSEMFRSCFMKWVEEIRQKISGEIVAIDGKTICGSKNIPNSKKAVHIVSAWAAQNGLVWGELAVNDKSNEITAIPALLKMLELSSCIVTIDAMGPQKEIAKEIIESKADYVLVVKENQPGLYDELSLFFFTEKKECDYAKTTEKSYGRLEKRECYSSTNIHWLSQRKEWKGLAGIGMIVSNTQLLAPEDSRAETIQYVIYSQSDMTAAQLLAAKRQHWSVENNLHWVLDVDFGEDHMRMRTGFAAENMNILRHLALNLLKAETSFKGSLKLKMKKCALSRDYLLKVFSFS